MTKYIESHKVGKEEAYLCLVEYKGMNAYRVGISSYGDAVHSPRCTTYFSLEEAKEAYEFYKDLVDNQ